MTRIPLAAPLAMWAVTASCSVVPHTGIDHSRHRKAGTDWEAAQSITGIPADAIVRYRTTPDPIELTETRFIAGHFEGSKVYVANFSPHCDQEEGRPPAFQIKADGPFTVRNLFFKGTGHDGIHIHSGKGQGWNSKTTISRITFENCIFTACEDAVTVGFGTRDITFRNCIFVANPDGRYRDKLVQLNHADGVRFIRCYFSPTKNGVEFKSGARISAEGCFFDRCATAFRVRTADSYRGIVPDQPTRLASQNCTYRFAKQAFFLDGSVTASSRGDRFPHSRKLVAKNGARLQVR